jgi:hypothetical protein
LNIYIYISKILIKVFILSFKFSEKMKFLLLKILEQVQNINLLFVQKIESELKIYVEHNIWTIHIYKKKL